MRKATTSRSVHTESLSDNEDATKDVSNAVGTLHIRYLLHAMPTEPQEFKNRRHDSVGGRLGGEVVQCWRKSACMPNAYRSSQIQNRRTISLLVSATHYMTMQVELQVNSAFTLILFSGGVPRQDRHALGPYRLDAAQISLPPV